MKQVKFSLISGLIISLIVLIINLFKNSFFITIFRTLLTAVLVSGILYLAQFILKQFFNIDLFGEVTETKSDSENLSEESENLDNNINITIGEDENLSFSTKDNDFELNKDNNLSEEYSDIEKMNNEERFKNNKEKSIDNDFVNDINLDFEESEKDNRENVTEDIKGPLYNEEKLLDKTKSIKERLGYDATYEELAKAIRTELKKDKE